MNTTEVVKKISERKSNGAWSPSCADHTYVSYAWTSNNWRVPYGSVNSLDLTISNWIKDK